ncbi:transporter substrate-binding domain-containing protein [Aeromonas veronii]|nr:transporter substrate-binding domain-containing protein [Aeromonas veronii]
MTIGYIIRMVYQCEIYMSSQSFVKVMLSIFLITLSSGVSAVENSIVLVSSEDTFKSRYGCWLYSIYSEAFSRLGYKLIYRGVPGGRAPILAEDGSVDGEIHRPLEYQQQTRTMIRVNESHFDVTIEAYVYDKRLKFNSWDDLRNGDLRIEFRRGSKRAGDALSKLIKPSLLTDVNTTEQGLKKLIKRRVDIFIEQTLVFDKNKKELLEASPEYEMINSAGIVDTLKGYAYLNKKHSKLAQRLALTLKIMKAENTIELLKEQYCYHD